MGRLLPNSTSGSTREESHDDEDEDEEDFASLETDADTAELTVETLGWVRNASDGYLRLIDQTRLPTEFVQLDCYDVPMVWEAIRPPRVRGRPRWKSPRRRGVVLGDRRPVRAIPKRSAWAFWTPARL